MTQAQALIPKTDFFMGMPAPGLILDGCEMHRKLLVTYDKVIRARPDDVRHVTHRQHQGKFLLECARNHTRHHDTPLKTPLGIAPG
ncbi:MAG: hypothetical protein ACKVP2_07710 [Burkholderiales bacterium]